MSDATAPRVLMFVPKYPYPVLGGLERQAHELARALQAAGLAVEVLSGRVAPGQSRFERVDGIPVRRVYWPEWKPLRFLVTSLGLLWTMAARRRQYEVVHIHQHSWVGLYVGWLGRCLAKPVLTKLPIENGIDLMRQKWGGSLRVALLKRADGLVAMNEQSLAELRSIGFPVERALKVPNGVALQSMPPRSAMPSSDSDLCRVVYVGRLVRQKDLGSLLEAWVAVRATLGRRVRLELWGNGELEPDLRQQAESLGLRDSVVFCGHVSNVGERLREVDVFVLPSAREGNSNALLEAMEAGLPIVASRVGGAAMQLGGEGAPLLFDAGDPVAMSERILLLASNPGLRRSYGAAMRRRAEEHFDISKVAGIYHAAYRALVAGKCGNLGALSRFPATAGGDWEE